MNWIDSQDQKPEEGQRVLMKIAFQRFCGGVYCEDEILITGGIKDGDWFVGNDMMIWDYDYNLGFSEDDVLEWALLSDIADS